MRAEGSFVGVTEESLFWFWFREPITTVQQRNSIQPLRSDSDPVNLTAVNAVTLLMEVTLHAFLLKLVELLTILTAQKQFCWREKKCLHDRLVRYGQITAELPFRTHTCTLQYSLSPEPLSSCSVTPLYRL